MADDLADFFDLQINVKRTILPGSQTKGIVEIKDGDIYDDIYPAAKPARGTDYAQEYIEKEKEELTKILTNSNAEEIRSDAPRMSDIDTLTSVGTTANIGDITSEVVTQVYDEYDFSKSCNTSLPVYVHKEKLESVINAYQVTIIHGATGCGKSTQIPQYILDYCVKSRTPCNIVITQPRRIAAISLARRVSQERGWPLGSLVGYQVGLMNESSEDTRLKYVTTGVLLQQLVNKKTMTDYTHVILDEVHERDQDMDFAILLAKKLLRTNSPGVKVILMSATFNVTKFSEYFAIPARDKLVPAPIINLDEGIPQTGFKVREIYLCQMGVLGPLPEPQENDPGISEQMYKLTVKLIQEFDKIEQEEEMLKKGAVLVFLPGIYEIEELYNHLLLTEGYRWWVKPLHSSITVSEQQEVFKPPPTGYRKIILATNIAESSITVPDIVFVIDFCLTKCLICDQTTNFSSLQLCWASKTNCIQRAGRAGRVADGRVYRLVPQHFFDNILDQEGVPEMLRCPLERLVLQAKLFGMGTPKGLLALALDPPDLTNLENTVLVLKEAGALLPLEGDELNPFDGDITFLGRVMAKLPVDIFVAKLIVLGHIYSVLEECIIMGSAMSLKSVFSAPFQERLAAYNSKLTWADRSCSDSICFLNAYKVWAMNKQNGYFSRSAGGGEQAWARRYFIQLKTMNEIHLLVTELTSRLKHLGIENTVGPERVNWNQMEKPLVLKIVLAGAFYPNFFVRGAHGGQIDESEAVKLLGGKDPFNAIYFQGMPMDQPGPLYVKTIKHALKDCAEEIKVSFDNSSKVFVEFGRKKMEKRNEMEFKSDMPGRIHIAVYRAVKIRQLKIPVTLYLLKPQEAQQRATKLGIEVRKSTLYNWQTVSKQEDSHPKKISSLPPVDVSWIEIRIEHVIDPGHFWATNADENTNAIKVWMMRHLREEVCLPLPPLSLKDVQVGKVYLAPYTDIYTYYYRARVQAIIPRRDGEAIVQVFFVDYGNTEQMPISSLRNFTQGMIDEQLVQTPPLAFECILSELQPSLIKNPQGIWTNEARIAFQRAIMNTSLYAKVYSVVHGVVSLELLKKTPTGHISINEWLIKEGFAQRAEESYLSKMNHEMRVTNDMDVEVKKVCEEQEVISSFGAEEQDPDPPKKEECRMQRCLRGPYSPLEMQVYGLTKASIAKTVQIEWNSVNSVLLDSEPQDPHDRLLVAQCVGQSTSGDRLNLRHTTLMPNIHGLPALIALIFTPSAELRTDENRTRLTGAICGLGYDKETGRSLFPDHDIEITFDTEFTMTDMLDINRIRYWMNNALYKERDEETPERGLKEFALCQEKMKIYLFKLLKVKRKSQEVIVQRRQFHWGQLPPEYMLNPSESEVDRRSIFRLHWGVELANEDINDYNRQMLKHIQELKAIENGVESFKELTCKLCHVRLFSIISLKLHLKTAQHLENEQEIRRYR